MLMGFKVQIKGNGVRTITLNATTTSIQLNNLTSNGIYTARVAAMTSAGQGPFSSPVPLLTSSRTQNPQTLGPMVPIVYESWFVIVMVILAITVMSSVIGIAFWYKRKHSSAKQLGHLNVPVVNATQLNAKESLWIDRGWRAADCDKDSSIPLAPQNADYAEVDTRSLSTFYNCRKSPDNPTPYATTMILPPPSWSELLPPPPDHPPPNCPEGMHREIIPAPPPRSNCGSQSGYACYPNGNVRPVGYHPRAGSCNNCDAHCSLASGSSGRRSNRVHNHYPHHSGDDSNTGRLNFKLFAL